MTPGPFPPVPSPYRQWDGHQWLVWTGWQWIPDPAVVARPGSRLRQASDATLPVVLALLPVLGVAAQAGLLYAGVTIVPSGLVAAVVLSWVLAILDAIVVKRRGYPSSIPEAAFSILFYVLLMPVYLWRRAKHTGKSHAPFAIWLFSAVFALIGSAVLYTHFVRLDITKVEGAIAADINSKAANSSSASVDSPSRSVYQVHDSFVCTATEAGQTIVVRVHIEDSSGSLTWGYGG